MQLVIGADVSGRDMRLLDDSAEAIQRSTETVLQNLGLRSTDVGAEGTSGRWYAEFIQKVNNEMEERDAQLTLLNVCNNPHPPLCLAGLSFYFSVLGH
jgi:hypothetical protein